MAAVLLNSAGKQAITGQPATLPCFSRAGNEMVWEEKKPQQQRNPSKISTLQLLLTQHKPKDQESSDLSHPAELSMIQIPDLPPGFEFQGRKRAT